MTTYATLSELKTELAIPATDTIDDATLTAALEAATSVVRDYCRRDFTPAGTTATPRRFSPLSPVRVLCDDIGSATGLVVEVRGFGGVWTTLDASTVELFPWDALASHRAANSVALTPEAQVLFPGGSGTVRITARWGWPEVPPQVVRATVIQASRLWKRKDAPFGIAGSPDIGQMRLLARVDADVQVLLDPLVLTRGMAL